MISSSKSTKTTSPINTPIDTNNSTNVILRDKKPFIAIIILATPILAIFILLIAITFEKKATTNVTIPPTAESSTKIETITPSVMPATVIRSTITIDDQTIFIYKPSSINKETNVLLYSHGSNETLDGPEPSPDTFAEALSAYGNFFSQHDTIFIVSEMYGTNWGDLQSQKHLENLIIYANQTWDTSTVHLYGFSMGALPVLRYASRSPENISSILLLAPSIRIEDWDTQRLIGLSDIPIKIWHGSEDINIPIELSYAFVDHSSQLPQINISLIEVPNEAHTHFVQPNELLEFMNQST